MARKSDTPEKLAMWEFMKGYLKQNDLKIKEDTDVNALSIRFGTLRNS